MLPLTLRTLAIFKTRKGQVFFLIFSEITSVRLYCLSEYISQVGDCPLYENPSTILNDEKKNQDMGLLFANEESFNLHFIRTCSL